MPKKEEAEDFGSSLTGEDSLIYSSEGKMSNSSNSYIWELHSSWKHFKKWPKLGMEWQGLAELFVVSDILKKS